MTYRALIVPSYLCICIHKYDSTQNTHSVCVHACTEEVRSDIEWGFVYLGLKYRPGSILLLSLTIGYNTDMLYYILYCDMISI